MPHKPLASNQLTHKQLPEQENSADENEQFNATCSSDDEQPIPPPLSKHPNLSSPSSSSSTPLIRSSTSTSTNTTNATINSSNDGNDGGSDGGNDSKINLFQEMNHINSQLITLDDHFSISADYKYFIDHHEMLDEFNENVLHFLWKVNRHRKCAAFKRLSEDALFHILQYVTKSDLIKNCQWVSIMWRQQLLRKEFTVELTGFNPLITESLLRSEFIGRVVSLRLIKVSDELMELLVWYSSSLSKLQHLDLDGNMLGVKGVKFLKELESSCENLTSLNLSKVQKLSKKEALDILSSKLLANCKTLQFSNKFDNMAKYLAEISQLSQLTHLELNQLGHYDDDGLEEFLQSKVNLQCLSLQKHNLRAAPNLFTINSTGNLKYNTVIFKHLIKLDISECKITNQTLFDIILSPKLPNLTTLIATNIINSRQSDQIRTPNPFTTNNSAAGGHRNSSNLTELNMNHSSAYPVAEMIKFTPKLKKLLIWDLRDWHTTGYEIVEDYSFLVHANSKLSQLEYLEITSRSTGWIELIFTNSMFSNLKYLNCRTQRKAIGENEINREVKIIEECVNLPKLERVREKMVKGDTITEEQEEKFVQAIRNNPLFNQLKIEHFDYESVYPNVEMNNDSRISINL